MSHIQPKIKMRSIADHLGVSVSLVSKVLNDRLGKSGAKSDTIAAIKSTARELGYRKNAAAAALSVGRQNVIAAYVHGVGVEGSGLTEQFIHGITSVAAARGQRLMLRYFETAKEFRSFWPEINPAMLDGAVIAGVPHPELVSYLCAAMKTGVPLVTAHDYCLDPAIPNVASDQCMVGRIATEHLIARGCRRIAQIASNPKRAEGYVQALRAHGLPVIDELIYKVNSFPPEHYAVAYESYTLAAGESAVSAFTSTGVEYDGIVAHSDQQAIGAMNALLRQGKRIPTDVKIIGVDNSPFCNFNIVPLSSISEQYSIRGKLAAEMLLDLLDGNPVANQIVAPFVLPRASSLFVESLNI